MSQLQIRIVFQHQMWVSFQHQTIVASQYQTRVTSSLKFTSKEDKHDSRIFINERCVLSPKEKSMSLLLQSVQQYTAKAIDNSTTLIV